MASYALQCHLLWRTQRRLGQFKMEDDQEFKMEDDQEFRMEDNKKNSEWKTTNKFQNGRRPKIFQIEDDRKKFLMENNQKNSKRKTTKMSKYVFDSKFKIKDFSNNTRPHPPKENK